MITAASKIIVNSPVVLDSIEYELGTYELTNTNCTQQFAVDIMNNFDTTKDVDFLLLDNTTVVDTNNLRSIYKGIIVATVSFNNLLSTVETYILHVKLE